MDKELNDDSENELKEDQSFKSLEDFFAKEINTVFTPQELMILSSSLNYVGQLLVLFKQHTNIAVFDVKEFTAKHPEYAYIDFNDMANLDPDIRNDIKIIKSKLEWYDLSECFIKNPIVINGCFKFGLKEIVGRLSELGLIKSNWSNNDSTCSNGNTAMVMAQKAYQMAKQTGIAITKDPIMLEIMNYNKTDCVVIHEIIELIQRKIMQTESNSNIDPVIDDHQYSKKRKIN